jgi:Cu/Ag efflux pump CusA
MQRSFIGGPDARIITTSWGGSFQDLQEGMARLSTVVPVALAVILLLLYLMFGARDWRH